MTGVVWGFLWVLAAPPEGAAEPVPFFADTKFYRELLKKKACTNDDGARIVLAYVEHGDSECPPGDRVLKLKVRQLLAESWEIDPAEGLSADLFAYMICRTLGVKGGLSARLFGLGPRTAYREAVNLRLMRANGQGRTLSGPELLSVMARVEEYRKKREND